MISALASGLGANSGKIGMDRFENAEVLVQNIADPVVALLKLYDHLRQTRRKRYARLRMYFMSHRDPWKSCVIQFAT
jgi:hypothetical protein